MNLMMLDKLRGEIESLQVAIRLKNDEMYSVKTKFSETLAQAFAQIRIKSRNFKTH